MVKVVKEKAIVYALGDGWKYNVKKINEIYDIIACSDQDLDAIKFSMNYKFISPNQISNFNYDKIILGCKRRGVREVLALKYGISVDNILYYDETLKNSRKKYNRKQKHDSQLTVIIPTYNRKQRLKRTLDLLEMQTDNDFKIIILDNCSNYCIEDIYSEKSEDFQTKITIVRNKKNIGMAANLGSAFLQRTEGWVWMLSDDDIPSVYAIEDIYEEIENSNQIGVINFLIYDISEHISAEYKDIESLHELWEFYRYIIFKGQDEGECAGDFIYFSNKVYKMEYIQDYYEKIFDYAYSGIPQLVPLLFMLYEGKANIRISNKKIVAYEQSDGDHWDWIKTMSGMRIIADFPLNLTVEDRKTFYRLTMYNYIDNLIEAIDEKNYDYGLQQIEKIYNEIYFYSLNDKEKEEYRYKIKRLKTEKLLTNNNK